MKPVYLIPVLILFAIPLLLVAMRPSTSLNPSPSPAQTASPQQGQIVGEGCKVGGCSGTVCQNAEDEDAITTCEWKEEYACYRNASCQKQTDGNCGWVMTSQLQQCIEDAQNVSPEQTVLLDNLESGDTVASPLTITGTVPAGWMFEASFPISVLDADKNAITQSYGSPIPPDDWMSGRPVRFTATLTFETDAESGFIRFEKDNPSGLPENAASYDLPVNFAD